MKKSLRKLFLPILNIFESGEEEYIYKKSHRKILLVMGVLFLFLSIVSAIATIVSSQMGGLIPFLVFFAVGAVCEIVGFLGSDRSVAKIWGSK
jgi:isoprenylcysteine carboxyl methyltransferase (ICMT) family protein YpbQ